MEGPRQSDTVQRQRLKGATSELKVANCHHDRPMCANLGGPHCPPEVLIPDPSEFGFVLPGQPPAGHAESRCCSSPVLVAWFRLDEADVVGEDDNLHSVA
jgi:hypothetical protein